MHIISKSIACYLPSSLHTQSDNTYHDKQVDGSFVFGLIFFFLFWDVDWYDEYIVQRNAREF